jgi:prevent-host-death family protein
MYISVYTTSMTSMTVTEVRARLREALEQVKAGEEVELSQNGQVIAVLVHPAKLQTRIRSTNTVAADALLEKLKRARSDRSTLEPVLTAAFAERLESDVRRDRDGDEG